jgi:hypothetical protein
MFKIKKRRKKREKTIKIRMAGLNTSFGVTV